MNRYVPPMLVIAAGLALLPPAFAEIHTEPVQYQHGDTRLQGYLAYDDAIDGPRPGVLIIHEWWGLNDYSKDRAKQLAGLGYVAFALDMYGDGKHTADPAEAKQCSGQFNGEIDTLRARAQAGLDVLASHDRVAPTKIAAIGYCFGGTTALELAYSGAPIQAVVSFHGGPAIPRPQDLPNIHAKILICHGAADPLIPAQRVEALRVELLKTNLDWQLIAYGQAVHSFTNPYADQYGVDGVAYHPLSDQRSWQDMRQLFDEVFNP